MNLKQFDKIVTDQLSRSELVLMGKGTEYAEEATDETEVDRLAHFKKAAALQDMTTAQAAFGMLSKHLVSVADMVGSRQSYPLTQWNEKITDSTPSKWPAAMAPRLRASSFACLARNKRLSEVFSEISKTSSSLSAYETY